MSAPEFPAEELENAVSVLQSLIRFDTTNPPGNEREAIEFAATQCEAAGLTTTIVGKSEARPNLVAKWSAGGHRQFSRPLILSCHLDVVPAEAPAWTHPPFSAHNDGTYIWGRGAIDMKGFAAMGLAAITRLRKENLPINRDLIFVAVCDEEAGTHHGSQWLVENHHELLGTNPEYVINEVGGFTVHQKGRRFYPVQVAEKGVAWIRLTVSGTSGHSSLPSEDNAVVHLSKAITAIGSTPLPWHPGKEVKRFIAGFAEPEGPLARALCPLLSHPVIGPKLLPLAVANPSRRRSIEALLRNTANPTSLITHHPINVIPAVASVDIDGRLAPGQSGDDLIRELETITDRIPGVTASYEILEESPSVSFDTDTDLFRNIEEVMADADPEGHLVPSMIPGFTDSRNYAKLGANCYGFYPLQLPEEIDFASLFHGVDERIPIEGLHWGIKTLTRVLRRFLTD
ncbi:MAG: M20/M25/M40 family metallo-hydrolase [Verrucomicrobiales bacterium]|nr:M20/M25/M40 family metallo-hydrolase [Verrucomicrobiales bacterium]